MNKKKKYKLIAITIIIALLITATYKLHLYPFDTYDLVTITIIGTKVIKDEIPINSYNNITDRTFKVRISLENSYKFHTTFLNTKYDNNTHRLTLSRPLFNGSFWIENTKYRGEYFINIKLTICTNDTYLKNIALFNGTNEINFTIIKNWRSIDVEFLSNDTQISLNKISSRLWRIGDKNGIFIGIRLPSFWDLGAV